MRLIRNHGTPTSAQAPDGVAVRARHLVVAYGSQIALSSSDFEVPAQRLTNVIGPNGSGKSTLLHAIGGIVEPRSGTVEVFGSPPAAHRRRLAYVFQAARINEALPITVREVVAMGRYARRGFFGRLTPDDREAIEDAMDRLRITDLRHRHLRELSGGQRQRVFVAQGLAQGSDLLLLDEPLTGLDIPSHERIDEVLESEVGRGVTVIVTTHDLDEARRADHVVLLAGRVVASGPPADVLSDARLTEAYGGYLLHFEKGRVVLDDAGHGPGAGHSH